MSQRLISTRKHPITGEEIKPLWFDQNGVPFFPPIGAAPEDDNDDADDSDDDGSGEDDTEGQDSGDSTGGTVTAEEFAALKKRMQAADQRASAAEKKVKEFEDKDKDEATKATERITTLESENSALKEKVGDLTLKNAFLSSNDIDWHDKDVALSNADLSEVMQEDGTVDKKALKKALEDLSKAKPFLVKKADKEDDLPGGQSGSPVGSGRKGDKKKVDEEALRRKYPALYL